MQEGHFYGGLSEFELAERCQSPVDDFHNQLASHDQCDIVQNWQLFKKIIIKYILCTIHTSSITLKG